MILDDQLVDFIIFHLVGGLEHFLFFNIENHHPN